MRPVSMRPLAAILLVTLWPSGAVPAAPAARGAPRLPPFVTHDDSVAPSVRRARGAPPPAAAPVPWSFRPVQIDVDLERSKAGALPVVVVPIPVPVTAAACAATAFDESAGGGARREQVPARRPPPAGAAPPRDEPPAPARLPPPLPEAPFPGQASAAPEDDAAPPPVLRPVFSSQRLVEEFRAQTPRAPELPPMLLSGFDASERARVPDGGPAPDAEPERGGGAGPRDGRAGPRAPEPGPSARSPPPAYRAASLRLVRGQVTVPRADYTEPYTVWFDERSGAARVDFHGGSASTFRARSADGRVRRALVWAQRSGSGDVRRCATATAAQDAAPAGHPALPDLAGFTFVGKEDSQFGPVEVWQRTVESRAGEHGAARDEALTTRHEMRLTRVDGAAVPLRYTVTVDSSALGAGCDGYEHLYQAEDAPPPSPAFFDVDLDRLCDSVETLDAASPEDVARLEPLREFTLPHRDPRYDGVFDGYRAQFARRYADAREEAVRKNVVMQSTRFAAAGNRQGATAELGATPLADRLRAELPRLMGAGDAGGAGGAVAAGPARASFPYSRDELRAQERRLPSGFDWRPRGAVSPVGFQGFDCASCWAFAVSGAVEGALFRRTRRLVPLSYQCLVDCAHPFGGKGCGGTWPSHAYAYVQERGLPALDEYPSYKEKVEPCSEQRVPSQTRISGHVNVTADSVPALKVAIRRHAPSVVIVDAECQSFILHKKGVLYDDRCGKSLRQLHHAVLAVGWGERRGEPHFILKNSWSAKWGERGYVRVHARSNTCGVLTMPSYPLLEDGDVRQPLRAGARPQRSRLPAAAPPGGDLDYDY